MPPNPHTTTLGSTLLHWPRGAAAVLPVPLVAGMVPEPFSQVVPWVALGIGVYWLYLLYRRAVRSTSDPSYRKFTSGRLGSASMLISGAYLSAAIAGVIAVLTWPLPVENRVVGLTLVAIVVFHAALEYRESTTEGS